MNQKKITLDLSNLSIDQTKDFNACLIEHRKDFDQMLYKLSREKDLHPDVFLKGQTFPNRLKLSKGKLYP